MPTNPDTDPLEKLLVTEVPPDRVLLASLLQGVGRLDLSSRALSFLPGSRDRLSKRQLVLVVLLAQAAMHLLEQGIPEGLRPQEIETLTGIDGNTLRPVLKVLTDRSITRRNVADGSYSVPAFGFEAAAKFLQSSGE